MIEVRNGTNIVFDGDVIGKVTVPEGTTLYWSFIEELIYLNNKPDEVDEDSDED